MRRFARLGDGVGVMILPLAVAAVLATGEAANVSAEQFDLVCAGNRTGVLSGKVKGVEPFQSEFRIDLRAKTWCGGDCTRTYDIDGAVTTSEIVLTDDAEGPWESRTRVDRTSGKFTSSTFHTAYGLKSGGYSEGECQRAQFKGMPPPKF
jgi:hypothetical protein